MAKNHPKQAPPRAEFDSNSKVFVILSWAMGILCFLFAGVYGWMFTTSRGTEAELMQSILYLFGANLITPALRRMWGNVLGIRLQGNRLVFAYLGLFLAIMGLGWYGGLRQQQLEEARLGIRTERGQLTHTPVDSLLAPAQSGLFWGYVNTQGKWVIPPDGFTEAKPFVNGYAQVTLKGKTTVIDRTGNVVDATAPPADSDTRIIPLKPASEKGLWGWQDSTGHWVISPKFEAVGAWGRAYSR